MKHNIRKALLLLTVTIANAHILHAQWTDHATVSTNIIWNIEFADENTVYAVGDSLLMKSDDAGITWTDLLPNIAPQGSDGKLYSLHFLNKDTGFVFTNSFTKNVFRTYDGGQTWTDVSQPALSIGLLDMHFVSDRVGYATCGYDFDSTLAKTTDGGTTWHKLKTPSACFAPMALHFMNEQVGFYGEDEIYKTSDGGQTWKLTTTPGGWIENNRMSVYEFLTPKTGFVVTDEWRLYKTVDSGDSWFPVELPFSEGWGCRGLDFDQNKMGYLAGFGQQKLLICTDGYTWDFDPSFPNWQFPTCVSVSPGHKVIVGCRNGDVVVKENPPLGVAAETIAQALVIRPNPTTGKISISCPSGIRTIELINAVGQSLQLREVQQNSVEMDLGSYPKGLYFIKAGNGAQAVVKKVVLD